MCLTLESNARRLIAKKDIKCYKFMMIIDGKHLTPYRQVPLQLESELQQPEFIGSFAYIDIGIHSYKHLKDAKRIAKKYNNKSEPHYVIECIIPKDAEYYEGQTMCKEGYVSNRIKLINK
jgi:hypothetical protein